LTILTIALAAALFAMGSLILALRTSTPPPTSPLKNIAATLTEIPQYAQRAARSAVELVWTDNGHLSTAAAMVITPGNLAVTTTPIPSGASITGSSQLDARFQVTMVSHDQALGFSILRLSVTQPITPTGVLPVASAVLAIAPYFTSPATTPEIAWAQTTLGDPNVEVSDGVVSYLATPSDANLDGFADALAVMPSGQVVAVLTASGQWYSAQYVTLVAHVMSEDGGCHGRLGVTFNTAQGGGVNVVTVTPGPAAGHLEIGDILTEINGTPLNSGDALLEYLYASPAGEKAHINLLRDGRSRSTVVILGCQP
jgi:membrane-associated protease RseP (regulator of RpoE activity)